MRQLANLYKKALEHSIGERATIFDYGTELDVLWGEDACGTPSVLQQLNGRQSIVIAWDGFEEMVDSLSDGLTPLDWALAFSIKLLGNKNPPPLRIHILDLCGKSHSAWAMRMRHQLLAEMSWVTLHAPLISASSNGSRAAIKGGYRSILGHDGILMPSENGWVLNDGENFGIPLSSQSPASLVHLGTQWTASLSRTSDHHDLNNIIGPSILSGELGFELSTPVDSSLLNFRTRLKWMAQSTVEEKAPEKSAPPQNEPYNAWVIDDELGDGWGDVLDCLLGNKFKLSKISNPNGLLGPLGIRTSECTQVSSLTYKDLDKHRYQSRTYDWPGKPEDMTSAWLLVLDLRLFSSPNDEANWYRTLANAALALVQANGLAWPGFNEEEEYLKKLAALTSPLNHDSPIYDLALSLLPRLCALRWPSVPILIFSITGRRNLIAKLAQYGNILLSAPKPNVLEGNVSQRVDTFVQSWNREIDKAMMLIGVQDKLLRLHRRQSSTIRKDGKPGQHYHVVMALDETGNFESFENSAIGGVLLIAEAPTQKDAVALSVAFQEELMAKGVRFYEHPPYYADNNSIGSNVSSSLLDKKADIGPLVHSVLREARFAKCKLGAIRYSINRELYRRGQGYKDSAYLTGLSRCVELALCELLPSVGLNFSDKSVTFSLWFASKQTGYPKEQAASDAANRYDFRNDTANPKLVEAVGGFGRAYSVLIDAIGHRKCFVDAMKAACVLRTRKIPYQHDPEKTKPYQSPLHWYCPSCRKVFYPRSLAAPSTFTVKCTICNTLMVSDYSVVSHLADSSLSWKLDAFPNSELGEDCISMEFSFDVCAGRALDDFFHINRLFDQERGVEGLKLAFRNEFFLNGIQRSGSRASADLCIPLYTQLIHQSKAIDGNDLIELAGLPLRGPAAPYSEQPRQLGEDTAVRLN